MDSALPPGTQRFFGGVEWPSPMVSGGGRLVVGHGLLEAHLANSARRVSRFFGSAAGSRSDVQVVRHAHRAVDVCRVRLYPPWQNTKVVISDGRETAIAVIGFGQRAEVLQALRDAGFEPRLRTTWWLDQPYPSWY